MITRRLLWHTKYALSNPLFWNCIIAAVLAVVWVRSCNGQTAVKLSTWFSPRGGATLAIVTELAKVKDSVRIQAYTFTSRPIYIALLALHKAGKDVRIVLDRSQRLERPRYGDSLKAHGVPTFDDDKHLIAHNKVMILDGKEVFTGSFNFSNDAEYDNAENLNLLVGRANARKFTANWWAHRAHSLPW